MGDRKLRRMIGPVTTSIDLNEDLESRIRQLADRRKKPAVSILQEAVLQYVQREEARDSFLQEADASWTAYQDTGRHLNGPEVRKWLTSWGFEGQQPECHD